MKINKSVNLNFLNICYFEGRNPQGRFRKQNHFKNIILQIRFCSAKSKDGYKIHHGMPLEKLCVCHVIHKN